MFIKKQLRLYNFLKLKKMKKYFVLFVTVLTVLSFSCKQNKDLSSKDAETQSIEKYMKDNKIKNVKPTSSGLYYYETQAGTGKQATKGSIVKVHYTGKFMDGKVFDSSVERGEPIEFTLGVGQVIKGWDEGIALMKVGGKATLIIPSKLGYGAKGVGPIPGNTPLIFDVELVEVK
jgi:FKBP-type peptidyl-prolyl cis-trans isomerase FkpA/FKBP-type peptidyl-prolyl cis-trans isomerase FklB